MYAPVNWLTSSYYSCSILNLVQIYRYSCTTSSSSTAVQVYRTGTRVLDLSAMINLVKSPFDKITVLLLVLSLVDRSNFPR